MGTNLDIKQAALQGKYHWGWGIVFAIITLVTVALRYALPVRDGDLWWHMLYGKYFLDNKTLIADHTIFSWTPSTNDTIYCTWLPDIFLYLLHKAAGLPGLFAFRYFCLYLFILACFLYARKLGKASHPVVWLIILVGILMAYVAAFLKPEIVSFVLLTLLAWNWWHIRAGGRNTQYWCYGIPLIMLVWVNSHGGFIFGYIFLVCVATGEIMNTWWSHGNFLPKKVRKHLWVSLAITLLVVLINPYGWHYPFQLFFDLMPTQEQLAYNSKINAYISTFTYKETFHSFSLFANIAVVTVAGLSLLQLRQRKTEWSSLLSMIVFVLLYSLYFRTTFYLAPVFAFSAIYMLSTLSFSFEGHPLCRYKALGKNLFPAFVLVVMLSIAAKTLDNAYENPEGDVVVGNFDIACPNPVDEAEYIKQYFPDAKIGNSYSFGAYLLWKLWPENKVFFDSRHFPYKSWSDDFFALRSANGLPEMLKKYPSDLWTFGHTENIMSSYFRFSPDWQLAYYGRCGQVFISKGIPLPVNKKYMVSEKIGEVKSRFTALEVFLFALSIYDFETAENLLKLQNEKYLDTDKRGIAVLYQDLFAGIQAFVRKDYSGTLSKLEKYSGTLEGVGGYVVISHLNLAQQALNDKQIDKADFYVQKALYLLPDTFYTQFDAGLVAWLKSRQENLESSDEPEPRVWEENFRQFLRLAEGNEDFLKEEIDFAQRVLDYRSPGSLGKYPLLVPELKGLVE